MSVQLFDMVRDIDTLLATDTFNDYCPNGLQVEGRRTVTRLVSGVTACQALLDEAVYWQADAVLVHHGYFWRGEDQAVVGMKRRRLATLIQHDISLLAYHLPLDAHPIYGNNAVLGERLGIIDTAPLSGTLVASIGRFDTPLTLAKLGQRIADLTGREPLLIGELDKLLHRPAWCTGAAQDDIEQAAAGGADVYISGEVSERTVHCARELGIAFIAAGHHATERYGVQALGQWLAQTYGIEHRYIDIDNPV